MGNAGSTPAATARRRAVQPARSPPADEPAATCAPLAEQPPRAHARAAASGGGATAEPPPGGGIDDDRAGAAEEGGGGGGGGPPTDGGRPAAADGGGGGGADSADGLWVLPESERHRRLEDMYHVPQDKEVGRGHYGVVRRGVRRSDGGRVAVKTIPKRRAVYVEMLRNEIAILRALAGRPHVVALHDALEDDRVVHLVFELCAGGELFDSIADQGFRFSERQAARLVRRVLLAVAACHAAGICHRDIKPENVLLTAPGIESDVKVIDFGLATAVAPGEALTRHVGTPYYIAPEVLEKRYSFPCDLWSVGVVTFTLLCGFPPFWGDTEREIYGRVRRGHYAFEGPDWATRSSSSRHFISRLLQMDPQRRPTAAQALRHPWIAYEGEVPEPGSRRMAARLRLFSGFPWLKRLTMAWAAAETLLSAPDTAEWARAAFAAYCTPPQPPSSPQPQSQPGPITTSRAPALLRRRAQPAGGAGACGAPRPLLPALPPSVTGVAAMAATTAGGGVTSPKAPSHSPPPTAAAAASITRASLQAALRGRGLHLTESEMRRLYDGLDVDGDGAVGLVEFAAAVLPRLGFLSEPGPLLRAFARLDADGDGVIGVGDALALLRARDAGAAAAAAAASASDASSGPASATAFTAAAAALLAEADIDGDGVVSARDLLALVCGGEPHIL